ncbi:MAG: DnrO protein [Xanthomonadales bacterium]|nr:DnrO protein [Xanthomonadales bacterium]
MSMRPMILSLCGIAALCAGAACARHDEPAATATPPAAEAAAPAASATHEHEHEHTAAPADGAAAAAPASGERFAVDAPLQQGMGKIRTAVANLEHHEMGHLSDEDVVAQANEIEAQVQFLIANCKLDPQADAALHGIIGKLLEGAKALKDKPADATPVAPLRLALAEYLQRFDDLTWLPLAE